MKKIVFLTGVIAAALFGFAEMRGQPSKAPPARSSPTKELMRAKLAHSQNVLEGIAMEDFPLIAGQARKLRALSQQADWPAFNNPEYGRHVDTFRHNVDALAKAADDRNLDGVTLAYVKTTMNCVECHKFVRGKKMAGIGNDGALLPSGLPEYLANLNLTGGGL